jgi:thiosulfate reductase cytochrome b subunit
MSRGMTTWRRWPTRPIRSRAVGIALPAIFSDYLIVKKCQAWYPYTRLAGILGAFAQTLILRRVCAISGHGPVMDLAGVLTLSYSLAAMQLQARGIRHKRLVRATHWINALSFMALAVSGAAILLAHPRFYWGETGYFDTPAAIELPLKPNLDQSGWGRSLHFLAAWIAVANGLIYVAWGLLSGHFRHKLLPAPADSQGYSLLQRTAYLAVVFGLLPVAILSGLTMSPAVTAPYPGLFALFGGRQSARTIHFIAADLLMLFLVVHVAMTILSGFANNMRSMITGVYTLPAEEP